jgi:hypothetical protein
MKRVNSSKGRRKLALGFIQGIFVKLGKLG